MKTVLTIAGSDCSGGAGIQADIKTITAHKMYAMSAVTALTAQNTTGVYDIIDTSPDFLTKQLDCIFTDIFPDAVKIGMLSNEGIIKAVVDSLKKYHAKNVVLDTVMVSTSGRELLSPSAQNILIDELMPLADIITPNIPEAQKLCGFMVDSIDAMQNAARQISEKCSTAVLIKGGHLKGSAIDVLYENKNFQQFAGEHVENPNTHGTGCTLSSAIACGLADGKSISESIQYAKSYITSAIRYGLNLGKGNGPLNHCCNM